MPPTLLAPRLMRFLPRGEALILSIALTTAVEAATPQRARMCATAPCPCVAATTLRAGADRWTALLLSCRSPSSSSDPGAGARGEQRHALAGGSSAELELPITDTPVSFAASVRAGCQGSASPGFPGSPAFPRPFAVCSREVPYTLQTVSGPRRHRMEWLCGERAQNRAVIRTATPHGDVQG